MVGFSPYQLNSYYKKSVGEVASGEPFQPKYVRLTLSDDGILVSTFCTPEKLNSMTLRSILEVFLVLEQASRDSRVKVLILTGEGRAFTAGANIGDFVTKRTMSDASVRDVYLGYCEAGKGHVKYKGNYEDDFAQAGLILSLLRFPKPLLAVINGLAIGMGTTMLPYMDYVVASENAKFRTPFSVMGISPELGSSIVMTRFRRQLVFAEFFDAKTALAGGLIHAICSSPEAALKTAVDFAATMISTNHVPGVMCCKRIMNDQLIHEFSASGALERENDVINSAMASDYAREQLAKLPVGMNKL